MLGNKNQPFHRHSRESGNPSPRVCAAKVSAKSHATRERALWIPAVAGMTMLCLLNFMAQAADSKPDPVLCDALVKHTPDADVAYQPGVDVRGNPVAAAEAPGQAGMAMPDQIHIPLTLNLAKTLNLNTAAYPYNQLGQGTEATLGMLTVAGDRVSFNGKALSDDQQDKLAVLCLRPH